MTKGKPTFAHIGSVSEGTLREENLISAFADELSYYLKRLRLSRDQRKRFADLIRDASGQVEVLNSERDFDHDRDDAGELVDQLVDALNEIAPPYCYFGAIEGDGADFGFWPHSEAMRYDLPRLTAGDDITREYWGSDILLVNDHGNVSCGHVDRRGTFKAYWDCV